MDRSLCLQPAPSNIPVHHSKSSKRSSVVLQMFPGQLGLLSALYDGSKKKNILDKQLNNPSVFHAAPQVFCSSKFRAMRVSHSLYYSSQKTGDEIVHLIPAGARVLSHSLSDPNDTRFMRSAKRQRNGKLKHRSL